MPYLCLPDLEKGRVLRRLDEISFGIDQEQPRTLSADLPAQQQCRREVAARRQRLAVDRADVAQCRADHPCCLKHVRCAEEVGTRVLAAIGLRFFAEQGDRRLGDGEIAGGDQHEHAFSLTLPHMQLLEGGDVVNPGIGAGIGRQNDSSFQHHSHAISH